MRLDDEQASSNVEDRRGQRSRRGGFRVPMGRRGGGIGIGTIVLLGIMWLVFGVNPLEMLGGGGFAPQTQQQVPQTQQQQGAPAANDEMGKFASKVLSTTERTWTRVFQENGRKYEEPRMGAVFRFRTIGLRGCAVCDGAVLLSARQEDLHRPELLP